jgi:hypothetical protein
MSEIRINILTNTETISGTIHESFGDAIVVALTAEPDTVEEENEFFEQNPIISL